MELRQDNTCIQPSHIQCFPRTMNFLRGADVHDEHQDDPQNNNNINQILYIAIEVFALLVICLFYCLCVSLNITLIDHLQMRNINSPNLLRNWSHSNLRPMPAHILEYYTKINVDDRDMSYTPRPRANTVI